MGASWSAATPTTAPADETAKEAALLRRKAADCVHCAFVQLRNGAVDLLTAENLCTASEGPFGVGTYPDAVKASHFPPGSSIAKSAMNDGRLTLHFLTDRGVFTVFERYVDSAQINYCCTSGVLVGKADLQLFAWLETLSEGTPVRLCDWSEDLWTLTLGPEEV